MAARPSTGSSSTHGSRGRPVAFGGSERARPRRRASRRWPATLLTVAVGALCLGLAALAFLVVLPPTDGIRERLIAEVRMRTGRELVISGPVGLKLLPTPTLHLAGITLGPPPASAGPPTLTARALAVSVSFGSLLAGRIEPQLIRLVEPALDLRVDAQGRRSWDVGLYITPQRVRIAEAAGDRTPGRFSMPDLAPPSAWRARRLVLPERLPTVEIVGGRVRYADARLDRQGEARNITARLVTSPDAPLQLAADFVSAGERVEVAATLHSEPTGFRDAGIVVESRLGTLRYDGIIGFGDALTLAGKLDLEVPMLAEALRWLGAEPSSPVPAKRVALSSRITLEPSRVRLSELNLGIDTITTRGAADAAFGTGRPRLDADIEIDGLDLDRLRPREAVRRRPGDAIGALIDGENAPDARTGESAGVRHDAGARRRDPGEWSERPIAFAQFAFFDVEARARVTKARWRQVPIDSCRALVSVSDGVLKVAISDAQIHGGSGRAELTASSAGHVRLVADFDGVDVHALLSETSRFEGIQGRGRVRLDVVGYGASEREIVDTLSGTASLAVRPGAIVGWSVADIAERVRRLQVPDLARDAAARTPFDDLAASFRITDGVARSSELRLSAGELGVTSEGSVDLRTRTLDLVLHPRIGTGSQADTVKRLAASVPLKLRGPWDRPRLSADVSRALKSPQKAIEAAREVGKTIKDDDIDKAARKLLGDSPEAQKGAERAKKLLKQFLER